MEEKVFFEMKDGSRITKKSETVPPGTEAVIFKRGKNEDKFFIDPLGR